MSIRMVVTDLDGTLLRGDKTISDRSLAAIRHCRERGIKFVYATGRGESALVRAPAEHFDGYIQMNGSKAFIMNGAKAFNANGATLVYSRLIPYDNVMEILAIAEKEGISIAAEKNSIHYANFNAARQWTWIPQQDVVDFSRFRDDAEKIYAIAVTPEITETIRKQMPDDLHLFVSRDGIVMIMHKEATKSKAVAALAARWEIARDEIVAFGDDVNDIDMLEFCGIGVAMGNALDQVKSAADLICDTNENDGIAKWLESRSEIWM